LRIVWGRAMRHSALRLQDYKASLQGLGCFLSRRLYFSNWSIAYVWFLGFYRANAIRPYANAPRPASVFHLPLQLHDYYPLLASLKCSWMRSVWVWEPRIFDSILVAQNFNRCYMNKWVKP